MRIRIWGHESGAVRPPAGRDPLRDMLTIPAAARLRGVSRSTVRRAVYLGILPAWTVPHGLPGGRDLYLIPRAELDAWQTRCSDRRQRNATWHRQAERTKRLKRE